MNQQHPELVASFKTNFIDKTKVNEIPIEPWNNIFAPIAAQFKQQGVYIEAGVRDNEGNLKFFVDNTGIDERLSQDILTKIYKQLPTACTVKCGPAFYKRQGDQVADHHQRYYIYVNRNSENARKNSGTKIYYSMRHFYNTEKFQIFMFFISICFTIASIYFLHNHWKQEESPWSILTRTSTAIRQKLEMAWYSFDLIRSPLTKWWTNKTK